MALFEHFPYTNFHSLNIQWAIDKIQTLLQQGETLYTQLQEWRTDTDTELDTWKTQTLANINETLDELREWQTTTETDLENQLESYDISIQSAEAQFTALRSLIPPTSFEFTHGGVGNTGSLSTNTRFARNTVTYKALAGDYITVPLPYYARIAVYNSATPYSGSFSHFLTSNHVPGTQVIPEADNNKYIIIQLTDPSETVYLPDEALPYLAANVKVFSPASLKTEIDAAQTVANSALPLSATWTTITAGQDLNDLTNIGSYRSRSYSISTTLLNCPTSYDFRMYVAVGVESGNRLQFLWEGYHNYLFFRVLRGTPATWTKWKQVNTDSNFNSISADLDTRKALGLGSYALTSFTPLQSVKRRPTGSTFEEDTTYSGIPYNAQEWSGRMIMYDLTLEAAFTAWRNPYADLYSFDASNNPPSRADDVMWMGAVCSTWVSWATGRPLWLTTTEIRDAISANLKTLTSIYQLEVGDVFYQEGHSAICSGFRINQNGVMAVCISEMWQPLFRETWYDESQFWTWFYDGGTVETPGPKPYIVGRFSGDYAFRTIPRLQLVSDIITSRGDNTFFKQNEAVWTYITDTSHTLTAISPSGVSSAFDYTGLPQKIIDGASVPVYNLASIVSGETGTWRIKGSGDLYSRITIIGADPVLTLTESTGTSTIAGAAPAGTSLIGFNVIRMSRTTGAYPVPAAAAEAGFVGGIGSANTTLHNTASAFPVSFSNSSLQSDSYFVRLYFDTGAGYTFVDTPAIIRT